MDDAARIDENAPTAAQIGVPASASDDLSWAVVKMRAVERIIVNEPLIAAYLAATSPHSIRALKSDLEAFDLWCRRHNRISLPATGHLEEPSDYVQMDAEEGASGRVVSIPLHRSADFLDGADRWIRFSCHAGAARPSSHARRWKL